MIPKIFKLIKRAKIYFGNPKKNDLIVFDSTSINELKLVLKDRKYFILDVRYLKIKKIYISFNIIIYFLLYYRGNINSAYIASIIRVVEPKVVLTFIDNSLKFHEMAKFFKDKIFFIAIQNSVRGDVIFQNYDFKNNYKKKNILRSFYIPNFLTFGNYEKKLYKKLKIKVDFHHSVGSLRLANFLKHIKKKKLKKKYDICLVEDLPPPKEESKISEIFSEDLNKFYFKMIKDVIYFCKKNKKKFIFSLKKSNYTMKEKQLELYKKNLSISEYNFLKKNLIKKQYSYYSSYFKKDYSSYYAILKSKILIGSWTTMLREKLALREKILSYNFTKSDVFDFPIKKVVFFKSDNYQKFEKKVFNILKMKEMVFYKKVNLKNNIIEDAHVANTIDKINNLLDKKLSIGNNMLN